MSVREGSWYFEAVVERGNGATGAGKGSAPTVFGGVEGNAHVRVGWGRREANLDAAVGSDGYSYGIRDVGGEKVHLSRPKPYGKPFATGDVVGCLITLPERQSQSADEQNPATILRRRIPIQWKGQWYFEMNEYLPAKEMEAIIDREGKLAAAVKAAEEASHRAATTNGDISTKPGKKKATTKNTKKGKDELTEPAEPTSRSLPTLKSSKVEFFLNGEPFGPAYEDLYDFTPLPPLVQPSSTKKHHHHHHPFDPHRDILHDDGSLGYFPMVSCFGKGKVRVNFGPSWLRPPKKLDARAMSERWNEFREEERILDERDEAETAEKLRKEIAQDEKKRAVYDAKMLAKGMEKQKGVSVAKKKKKEGSAGTRTPLGSLSGRGTPTQSARATPVPSARDSMAPGTPAPAHIEDKAEGTPVKMERQSEAPPSRKQSKSLSKSRSRAGSVRSSVGPEDLKVEEGDMKMELGRLGGEGEADVKAEEDWGGEEEGVNWD